MNYEWKLEMFNVKIHQVLEVIIYSKGIDKIDE